MEREGSHRCCCGVVVTDSKKWSASSDCCRACYSFLTTVRRLAGGDPLLLLRLPDLEKKKFIRRVPFSPVRTKWQLCSTIGELHVCVAALSPSQKKVTPNLKEQEVFRRVKFTVEPMMFNDQELFYCDLQDHNVTLLFMQRNENDSLKRGSFFQNTEHFSDKPSLGKYPLTFFSSSEHTIIRTETYASRLVFFFDASFFRDFLSRPSLEWIRDIAEPFAIVCQGSTLDVDVNKLQRQCVPILKINQPIPRGKKAKHNGLMVCSGYRWEPLTKTLRYQPLRSKSLYANTYQTAINECDKGAATAFSAFSKLLPRQARIIRENAIRVELPHPQGAYFGSAAIVKSFWNISHADGDDPLFGTAAYCLGMWWDTWLDEESCHDDTAAINGGEFIFPNYDLVVELSHGSLLFWNALELHATCRVESSCDLLERQAAAWYTPKTLARECKRSVADIMAMLNLNYTNYLDVVLSE